MQVPSLSATTAAQELYGPVWSVVLLRASKRTKQGDTVDVTSVLRDVSSGLRTLRECAYVLGDLDAPSADILFDESPWKESALLDGGLIHANLLLSTKGIVDPSVLKNVQMAALYDYAICQRILETVTSSLALTIGRAFPSESFHSSTFRTMLDAIADLSGQFVRSSLITCWLCSSEKVKFLEPLEPGIGDLVVRELLDNAGD